MEILHYHVGSIMTNCYFLVDENTKCAAIVDPGDNGDKLADEVRKHGLTLSAILLTHGHYDHTTGVPELHAAFPEVPVYIHRADADGAGSKLFPLSEKVEGLRFYSEGDTVAVGSLTVEVLHTPGHSKGSVVLRCEDVLFAGDTLFAGSCGRVDLAGGDWDEMLVSLRRLHDLEGEYRVLPGHMNATVLSREREYNMYMKQAIR